MSGTNPLLTLFKEQLEGDCTAIAQKYGLQNRGESLIYWYFIRLHDFTDTKVGEVFCDGAGDLGIDVIWIDDDDLVHFYSFKNPEDPSRAFPASDVDRTISGLRVILNRKHDQIANRELSARLEDVYQQVPKAYRIHFVTSGQGIPKEGVVKMDALIDEFRGPSSTMVLWEYQSLSQLQEAFYRQSLPSVKEPITFSIASTPYMCRSGVADCYLFHVSGEKLASLYESHGERLLQRNIRVDQRDTATNRSIEETCSGADSKNFLHFNMDLSPFLRQTVKTQNSLNGELSHGIVS